MTDTYQDFFTLAANETEGQDFRIICCDRESPVTIVAPHGGKIENQTSEIARVIAAERFNLYCFEGTRLSDNYKRLHITSSSFNEPKCLNLVSRSTYVVTIHGCGGSSQVVYSGGLNIVWRAQIDRLLRESGFQVHPTGHKFPGLNPRNICNRGRLNRGVQLELSTAFRNGPNLDKFANTIAMACDAVA